MQTDGPFWDSLVFDGIDEVDVEAVTAAFGTIEVVARGRAAGAACPDCGRFSDRVHDRYQRRLKDLPLVDQGFVIRLTVRRFVCGPALGWLPSWASVRDLVRRSRGGTRRPREVAA
ncbi:transposase family protein [Streptomyces sp. NPDC057582]|uniref:transposase family protein n=1 Tax=Streptomyces sp. NPDC057582 TaxID=3346174 RepID=UPI0036831E8A